MEIGSEEQLMALANGYLRTTYGVDTHSEVTVPGTHGKAPDLVFRDADGYLHVCEGKVSASVDLVGQCLYWFASADFVWAAAPNPRKPFIDVCRFMGIGVISVRGSAQEVLAARRRFIHNVKQNRLALESSLDEKQKGKPSGVVSERETPPERTVRLFNTYVLAQPGIDLVLTDVIRNIGHHCKGTAAAKRFILGNKRRFPSVEFFWLRGDWRVRVINDD